MLATKRSAGVALRGESESYDMKVAKYTSKGIHLKPGPMSPVVQNRVSVAHEK